MRSQLGLRLLWINHALFRCYMRHTGVHNNKKKQSVMVKCQNTRIPLLLILSSHDELTEALQLQGTSRGRRLINSDLRHVGCRHRQCVGRSEWFDTRSGECTHALKKQIINHTPNQLHTTVICPSEFTLTFLLRIWVNIVHGYLCEQQERKLLIHTAAANTLIESKRNRRDAVKAVQRVRKQSSERTQLTGSPC